MSHAYQAVGWNRQKEVYDKTLATAVSAYLFVFLAVSFVTHPLATIETRLIRGFGTAAFLLLHVILSIGPLCRLEPRFLPLLYNRRHMGVTMFVLALAHGGFSLMQFHAFGDLNPFVSVLVSNPRVDSVAHFPFQPMGLAALVILFLMAATSHDFWLANLSSPVWKGLHMMVYAAYALLIGHVSLGILQAETSPVLAGVLGAGMVWIVGLHAVSALRGRDADRERDPACVDDAGFVAVCDVAEIEDCRAQIVTLGGERIAIFRYDGKVSAISNVCQHQNGPLGEGRIIDGCVTCPWHGFQYEPDTGASPPPFTEKVPTFRVKVVDGTVYLDARPNPPGTRVEPARIEDDASEATS